MSNIPHSIFPSRCGADFSNTSSCCSELGLLLYQFSNVRNHLSIKTNSSSAPPTTCCYWLFSHLTSRAFAKRYSAELISLVTFTNTTDSSAAAGHIRINVRTPPPPLSSIDRHQHRRRRFIIITFRTREPKTAFSFVYDPRESNVFLFYLPTQSQGIHWDPKEPKTRI